MIPVAIFFLLGLFVGSFLNVCITRIPAEEQVIAGRSHCRHCKKIITWRDNVPLVSFIMLQGKCRYCKSPIGWSYPAVELLSGILFAGVAARFGLTPVAAVYMALASALLVVSVIDWREMFLPDEITLPGIGLGILASVFLPSLQAAPTRWAALGLSLAGAVAGGGTLWLVGIIGKKIFKREAMGLGDVKLMAMVGALIGPGKVLLVNFFGGPLLGACVGLFLKLKYKRDLIPFGPFLSLATAGAVFWGDALIAWYLRQVWGG